MIELIERDILDHFFDAVLIVDSEKRLIFTNTSYERMINITREYAVKNHWGKAIDEKYLSLVNGVFTNKCPFFNVDVLIDKAGLSMVANLYPIKGEGNEIKYVVIIMQLDASYNIYKLILDMQRDNKNRRVKEVRYRRKDLLPESFRGLVGNNVEFVKILVKAATVSDTDYSVLIEGESGTGKDLLAQAIHKNSRRSKYPFVALNCAAIPEQLLESELFGYEAGSFTGAARQGKKGKFELANKGTVFLDEIGDMPLAMQAKLLRVIQNKTIEKIGSKDRIEINVRIICATNKNLSTLIQKNIFREDLFYRINVIPIRMLPLRERKDDLLVLFKHFLSNSGNDKEYYISEEVLNLLYQYSWPGNIRELMNVVAHSVTMAKGDSTQVISMRHIPQYIKKVVQQKSEHGEGLNEVEGAAPFPSGINSLPDTIEHIEVKMIKEALKNCRTKKEAIEKLGISRRNFYNKLKKYDLFLESVK